MRRVITYGTFDLLHYGHIRRISMNTMWTHLSLEMIGKENLISLRKRVQKLFIWKGHRIYPQPASNRILKVKKVLQRVEPQDIEQRLMKVAVLVSVLYAFV